MRNSTAPCALTLSAGEVNRPVGCWIDPPLERSTTPAGLLLKLQKASGALPDLVLGEFCAKIEATYRSAAPVPKDLERERQPSSVEVMAEDTADGCAVM